MVILDADACADVLYDCTHYALHHTKLPKYWTELKKYHLAHHYKNFDLAFGVTSMWFSPSQYTRLADLSFRRLLG